MPNIFLERDHSRTDHSRTTSSLLDHILTNASWKISQKGVIDVGLSDHQLIYCTRKILRTKANKHNEVWVRSLKKYTPELLIKQIIIKILIKKLKRLIFLTIIYFPMLILHT